MIEHRPRRILLVDDDASLLVVLSEQLRDDGYEVATARDGGEALRRLEAGWPDLILLDLMMPVMDGYQVFQRLRAEPATYDIPVIFVTAMDSIEAELRVLDLGAVDYITKPISAPLALARIATHLSLASQTHQLESLVAERTAELQQTRVQVILRLARALEFREGGGLTNRVLRIEQYVKLLAQALGAKSEVCEMLAQASALHDIGTLGVPDAVMRKTDALDATEWQQMRRHPEIGAAIIGEHKDPLLASARAMALAHHERWDGKGYPKGLAGDAIPLAARILAVADAFEAMTATQRYRDPVPVEQAARTVAAESGKQFDPALVAAFRKALPKMAEVHKKVRDELKGIHDLDFSGDDPA
jgi:putative two-component system response regulator